MKANLYRMVVSSCPLVSSRMYDRCISSAATCVFLAGADYQATRSSVLAAILREGWQPYDIEGESPAWDFGGKADRRYMRLRRDASIRGLAIYFFCANRWERDSTESATETRKRLTDASPRIFHVALRNRTLATITPRGGMTFVPFWTDKSEASRWSNARRGYHTQPMRRDAAIALFRSLGDSDRGVAVGTNRALTGYNGHDLADALEGIDGTVRFGIRECASPD